MATINWNYLAYLAIKENAKWNNYAGPIPGTELYARFCGCAVNTWKEIHEGMGFPTQENLKKWLNYENLVAKTKIYYTAENLKKNISIEEANGLLTSYGITRRPEGDLGKYTVSDFTLTNGEKSQYESYLLAWEKEYLS